MTNRAELVEKRRELEKRVIVLVQLFEEETGIVVENLSIRHHPATSQVYACDVSVSL